MIPYDVQLIGGAALHEGKIAEMATGEGKTLVSVMPAYLNGLSGMGVPPGDRQWIIWLNETVNGIGTNPSISYVDSRLHR